MCPHPMIQLRGEGQPGEGPGSSDDLVLGIFVDQI